MSNNSFNNEVIGVDVVIKVKVEEGIINFNLNIPDDESGLSGYLVNFDIPFEDEEEIKEIIKEFVSNGPEIVSEIWEYISRQNDLLGSE